MHVVSTWVSSHYLQAAVTYSQRNTTICTVTQMEAHQLLKKTITSTVDAGEALATGKHFAPTPSPQIGFKCGRSRRQTLQF